MEFCKNEAQIGLEYSDKIPWFDLKFFKGLYKSFYGLYELFKDI